MNLRQQAAADLQGIVEDTVGGFGWPVLVTDPNNVTVALVGLTTDIGMMIDPQTGQAITGRKASVALRIASLTAAGFEMPRGVSSEDERPWLVAFEDINGVGFTFKVTEAMPDRAIGLVVCTLEAYRAGVVTGVIRTNLTSGAVDVDLDDDPGVVQVG